MEEIPISLDNMTDFKLEFCRADKSLKFTVNPRLKNTHVTYIRHRATPNGSSPIEQFGPFNKISIIPSDRTFADPNVFCIPDDAEQTTDPKTGVTTVKVTHLCHKDGVLFTDEITLCRE